MLALFLWKMKKVFTNAFQESLDKSNCEPIKIWVDKVSEFENRSKKWWLKKNNKGMYSVHNEDNLLLLKDSIEP